MVRWGWGAADAGSLAERVKQQSSAATGAPFADTPYFQCSISKCLYKSISTQVLLMVGVAEMQHAAYASAYTAPPPAHLYTGSLRLPQPRLEKYRTLCSCHRPGLWIPASSAAEA